ncbi:hypothetical protein FHS43_001796 [Streptosporangium becharense]|uniref:Cytochrome P450 n=1 Tax=Streptosporangium becharense TaxID=1816182 RepID=A0A7W9IME3_9ACTN|nr:cytochrome P450 [Streptosporangium becharense]MBB2910533.1 hypothetical protein [Streptosporangium becharense]MBB5823276.1 hypothetical protein [Streptosporangium becharense]
MTSLPLSDPGGPGSVVLGRHAQVRAVLTDPRFTVAPVPRPPFAPTVAWLRGAVGRFAEGALHAERRAAVERVLAGLDTAALRAEASRLASASDADAGPVLVRVLAVALGVRAGDGPEAARAVAAVAPAYLPGPGSVRTGQADEAVARLRRLLGDPDPQRFAVLAGLLAQACQPTAALVRSALAVRTGACPVEDLLAETSRHDPPVRVLRRVARALDVERHAGRATVPDAASHMRMGVGVDIGVDTVTDIRADIVTGIGVDTVMGVGGDTGTDAAVDAMVNVVLDVAAANRDPRVFRDPDAFVPGRAGEHLTFGAGPRACPGRRIALALAAGAVEGAGER